MQVFDFFFPGCGPIRSEAGPVICKSCEINKNLNAVVQAVQ